MRYGTRMEDVQGAAVKRLSNKGRERLLMLPDHRSLDLENIQLSGHFFQYLNGVLVLVERGGF